MEIIKHKNSISWINNILKNHRLPLFILIILQGISSILFTTYPIIMLKLINAIEKKDSYEFKISLLIFSAFIIFQLVVNFIYSVYISNVSLNIYNTLKNSLLSSWLSRRDISRHKFHTGELINRLTGDINVIVDGYTTIIPNFISVIVKIVLTIFLLHTIIPELAYGAIVGGILMIVGVTIIRKIMKELHKSISNANGKIMANLQEIFMNTVIIRSFSVEEKILNDNNNIYNEYKGLSLKRVKIRALNQFIIGLLFSIAIIIGTIYASIGIFKGDLTIGSYVAISQLILQIRGPLVGLTGYVSKYFIMTASADRLKDLSESEMIDFISENNLLEVPECIKFNDVEFYYEDNDKKISNINEVIYFKDNTALIGESGRGKSTFLKLLIGVYPILSGSIELVYKDKSIFINDDNRIGYIKLFSYVPQGNSLISGSIREIISFGLDPDDEKINKVLKISCAYDFVQELPNKLDTILSEKGIGLSEGQIQRLTIARALYRERPFLVMDESTSALDSVTEKKLLKNLNELENVSIVVVTHKEEVLSICNRVINFNEEI
ncbi:ABC transporter ATP-binding protein [Gemelliphila palaticanis]|uniref:ABC transporter ATP-binding protein n=1 Tax=Gemelliphila palaticanis TaxID=81950 RepID=A0ABX2T0J9_9BACL|nr:ABC transporter ATP-binding protein [Gemella palaticanis]MBF0716164.1 ABC transporter ATP-binding protein [Gemella palaticanis]NYS48094.1 ABC transporter ATP-binding protein [Gemella palaticanis]